MPITVVTFDGTVDEASWTKTGIAGAAHTGLLTVDQPGSESSFMQATGLSAGILKLSIPMGPPEIERVDYVRLNPLLISGLNAANYPIIRMQLVVNGAIVSTRSGDADTADEFLLKAIEFGPLDMLGTAWRADPTVGGRQLWLSTYSSVARFGEEVLPDAS
jgi:hypothetical protein